MRTAEEQIAGLAAVAKIVVAAQCNCVTIERDMPVLTAYHQPSQSYGPTEVVYAVDGYDLWVDGEPIVFNQTAEQASVAVISEYRFAKSEFITHRNGLN
jgi:hypothetical protein